MSARVLQLTLRKLFTVSITASTQPWLTSTPTMHCGQAPNTPPRKSLHWPGATASVETGFIQFVPSKLHSQRLEDAHCQSQLRARGLFPLCLADVLRRGMCFAMTHLRLIRLLCSLQMCALSPDLVLKPLQGAFLKLFIYCQEDVKTLMCKTCFCGGTRPTAEQELRMNKSTWLKSVMYFWLSDGIIS